MRPAILFALFTSLGCGGSLAHEDAGTHVDAGVDAGVVDKTLGCVGTFGSALGSVGFMRFDGTVVAYVPPANHCPYPNSTHPVLEVRFSGAVYRMVIDVNNLASPGTIRMTTLSHDLIGGPWADGWHAVPLDYVSTLGLHSADFASHPTAEAVTAIGDAITIGAHVSVFASAQTEVNSAHLVHRNKPNQDGAIVVDVDGTPRWLLMAFSDQAF